MKLQQHALTTPNSHERLIQLERENALLKSELELTCIRIPPNLILQFSSHRKLTLSLKRLSDKLSLTEDTLLERTTQLTHANAELTKAKVAAEGAYALAAREGGVRFGNGT